MILEAEGDTVPFTMQVQIPRRLLRNGLQLRLEPILKQDSLISPGTFYAAAEKNACLISGSKMQELSFRGYFMNFPALQQSLFIVNWSAEANGKTAQLPERLIGWGISQIYHYSRDIIHLEPGFDADSIRSVLLSNLSPTAETYYLLAVMSARLYDERGVQTYLGAALTKDPSLRERALHDVEFIGFRK